MAHTVTPFSPVVDGEILPTAPWQAIAVGSARGIDLVVGHHREEYRLFIAQAGQLGRITDEQVMAGLRGLAPSPEVESAYRAHGSTADELYERIYSDWLFDMPGPAPRRSARCVRRVPRAGHRTRFGDLSAGLSALLIGEQPPGDAVALSQWMCSAWTAFAIGGTPG
ncbi:hypothetical protein OG426_02850 [Streptomyces canus]|uniref:hypothetical protein n=1 Tax=Streptomyces canus TaxID=58343 RepID=UPI00224FCBD7|nr:hypothetical protein [Streptomyces canus]MCX4853279.1 hypothetical protein [Streptomyces canus]WSW31516.1 hypothetical protein OG426_02850 [Streptomyces canus]